MPVRLFLVFFLFALISGCKRNSELSDTLAWMDNTYNPHEGVSGAYGHGHAGWYVQGENGKNEQLVSGFIEVFSHDGCQMSLRIQDDPIGSAIREMNTTSTLKFNLSDIDPASIKIDKRTHYGGFRCDEHLAFTGDENCDWAEINFSTHNAAPLIDRQSHMVFPNLQGKDHETANESKDTEGFFEADNPEYAERFAKALRHAVELCGGKPQSF